MKKQSHRFFFRLSPTKQLKPTLGAASHYADHKGLVTIDPLIAIHIANCVRLGQQPMVFVQGWWSEEQQVFTVGMAIPRTETAQPSLKPISTPSPSINPLMEMFAE
jgi:hypothetical protein